MTRINADFVTDDQLDAIYSMVRDIQTHHSDQSKYCRCGWQSPCFTRRMVDDILRIFEIRHLEEE